MCDQFLVVKFNSMSGKVVVFWCNSSSPDACFAGVAASSINNKLPNLVNLNEDPQLSEILLYVLQEGQTKVGRQGANKQKPCDIQLYGALVADYHW